MMKQRLDTDSKKVLQVLRSRGVASGRQLMKEAQIDENKLTTAVSVLQRNDLISCSGVALDPKEAKEAYFSIRPSAARAAELALELE